MTSQVMSTVTAQALGLLKIAVKVIIMGMKTKALRRPRKTDIEGADVTCWHRLFQVRAAAIFRTHVQTWIKSGWIFSDFDAI